MLQISGSDSTLIAGLANVLHVLKRWAAWPSLIRWITGITAAALVLAIVVAVGWLLSAPLPDILAHHDVGSAKGSLLQTARDDARGRLLTYAAGVFAAGALVFTAWNVTLYRKNLAMLARTNEITEQGQVTDRYTKAIEQLGSANLHVRLGGIYALERIAGDSARDHPTVMEVLTAFIREQSREQRPPPDPDSEDPERSPLPDVQAAITVVGRRDRTRDTRQIDLLRANLAGADLPYAQLPLAQLTGADLTGADLTGADLGSATLGEARLTGANLTRTHLAYAYLLSATLSDADLTGTDLTGANLIGVYLDGANLDGTTLAGADLAVSHLFNATLEGADLTGADLTRADLSGVNPFYASSTGTKSTNIILVGATLSGADLSEAYLQGADLTRADLTVAAPTLADPNPAPANLARADLTNAKFSGANLTGAILKESDLTGADFARAASTDADPDPACANLTGADLTDVKFTPATLALAELTDARWSEGVQPPEKWVYDHGRLKRDNRGA